MHLVHTTSIISIMLGWVGCRANAGVKAGSVCLCVLEFVYSSK